MKNINCSSRGLARCVTQGLDPEGNTVEPFSKPQVTDSISRNLGGSVVEFMGKGFSGLSEMMMETLVGKITQHETCSRVF